MSLRSIVRKSEIRSIQDRQRIEDLDWDECQLCGAHGADKRSFIMRCFYDMSEVIDEMIDLRKCDDEVMQSDQWLLRICKKCRGELLGVLRIWAQDCRDRRGNLMDSDGVPDYGTNPNAIYPMRVDGTIKMMTEAEVTAYKACHE